MENLNLIEPRMYDRPHFRMVLVFNDGRGRRRWRIELLHDNTCRGCELCDWSQAAWRELMP